MEIRLYFQMLRRGWWIVALTTLVAVATALVILLFRDPRVYSDGALYCKSKRYADHWK